MLTMPYLLKLILPYVLLVLQLRVLQAAAG
jgi:hypothetical protein